VPIKIKLYPLVFPGDGAIAIAVTVPLNVLVITDIRFSVLIIMKIGIILPSTSHKRDWTRPRHSYLFTTLTSLKETIDSEHTYKIYVGIDADDVFYNEETIRYYNMFELDIEFVRVTVDKGHVTKIWNILAQKAYDERYDYLYQCGDDITFQKKGWVTKSIEHLQQVNNIGMTGPRNTNGNTTILTQCFVHRTHVAIFGYFFPEEIRNWYCDDWINGIYPAMRLPAEFTCVNTGGEPRYEIARVPDLCKRLIARDREKVRAYQNQ